VFCGHNQYERTTFRGPQNLPNDCPKRLTENYFRTLKGSSMQDRYDVMSHAKH